MEVHASTLSRLKQGFEFPRGRQLSTAKPGNPLTSRPSPGRWYKEGIQSWRCWLSPCSMLPELATVSGAIAGPKAPENQITQHRGRIANTAGDSVISEFVSAVDAVSCAMVLQEVLTQRSAENRGLQIRIGIHTGDVVSSNGDVFGTAVNIAARLESAAQPGGIVVSTAVKDDVVGKLPAAFADMGNALAAATLSTIEDPEKAGQSASELRRTLPGATLALIKAVGLCPDHLWPRLAQGLLAAGIPDGP